MGSHKFWRKVAAAAAVISILMIGISLYSSEVVAEPRPLARIKEFRTVAVGVDNPNDFNGLSWGLPPMFQFRVHSNLSWTVFFTVSVLLPTEDSRPEDLPPVVVVMPLFATNCEPGPQVAYGSDGTVQKLTTYNSEIKRRPSAGDSAVFEVRAISRTLDQGSGRSMARYEISCDSEDFNTTSAGIASKNFELSYLPRQAAAIGLTPGLGGLERGFGVTLEPNSDYDSKRDDVAIDFSSLDPSPVDVKADVALWTLRNSSEDISIRGTTAEWWIADIEAYRKWIIAGLAAAFIGALIATVIPGNPGDRRRDD